MSSGRGWMLVLSLGVLGAWSSSAQAQGRLRMIEEEDGSVTITNLGESSERRSVDNKAYYRRMEDGGNHVFYTDNPDRYAGWEKWLLAGKSRSGSRFKDYIRNLTIYDEDIRSVSRVHDISPALVKAVMMAESAFNPNALSPAGAQGLMQLIPSTAQAMGVKDVWDARQNIQGGTRFLKMMLDRFDGDVRLAVAAYNAGPRNVEKYNGIPPFDETVAYVERVTDLFERFQENNLMLAPPSVSKAGTGTTKKTGTAGTSTKTSGSSGSTRPATSAPLAPAKTSATPGATH